MSWTDNMEDIKDRFWKGETTLEEERMLREHFLNEDSDDEMGVYFSYLKQESTRQYTGEGKIVDSPRPRGKVIHMLTRNMRSIAAGLAVLLAAFFVIDNNVNKSNVYIADTPEEALLVTQNTLAYINAKVNRSNEVLITNMSEFNKVNFIK